MKVWLEGDMRQNCSIEQIKSRINDFQESLKFSCASVSKTESIEINTNKTYIEYDKTDMTIYNWTKSHPTPPVMLNSARSITIDESGMNFKRIFLGLYMTMSYFPIPVYT